jgi:hypothetical protein
MKKEMTPKQKEAAASRRMNEQVRTVVARQIREVVRPEVTRYVISAVDKAMETGSSKARKMIRASSNKSAMRVAKLLRLVSKEHSNVVAKQKYVRDITATLKDIPKSSLDGPLAAVNCLAVEALFLLERRMALYSSTHRKALKSKIKEVIEKSEQCNSLMHEIHAALTDAEEICFNDMSNVVSGQVYSKDNLGELNLDVNCEGVFEGA